MGLSFRKASWIRYCLLVVLLALACGGDGGVDDLAGGGTGGTGISIGPASNYGSIEVNGRHFATEDAEIFVEGRSKGAGTQVMRDNLALGMVVRVNGDIGEAQDGTAQKIYIDDDIRGPLDSIRTIDSLTTELIVLGREILLTDTTRPHGVDLASLNPGAWVRVSGFVDATGRLVASYMGVTTGDDGAKIKGTVAQLDTAGKQFTINGILIDYQDATLVDLTQPSDGTAVAVTGILSANQQTITAERIESVDRFGVTDSDAVELTGVVLEATDTQLMLDSVIVNIDDGTAYVGGKLEDLNSGVRVEAEGELIDGNLDAGTIIFLDDAKIESDVASNAVDQSSLTLAGLTDITIIYNEITKVTGAAGTAEAITDDHHVKIIGRQTAEHTVLAIHIIVKARSSSKVKLQGTLASPVGEVITILGHEVDLSTIADENFESPEGVSVGYTAFLDSIATGDLITLQGEQTGGKVTWLGATAD
ncbi:hypothetical protein Dvar_18890 [Desulfosarcina variabilis str. Montpellier]|uniref:DUF5666 domain-containing protein n=1 Tax=Desulfosarcina variabilis TaxID=2300 RepID=UPI003AFADD4F